MHRRLLRIPEIRRRVVVRVVHRYRRAARKRKRGDQPVDVLPPEIPGLDVDQPSAGSVGKDGNSLHFTRAVVRMRLERLEFNVNWQHEGIVDYVMSVSRRNVDVLPSEPEHHGRAFGWIVGEVEAYRGSHLLRFPTRLHVNLDD